MRLLEHAHHWTYYTGQRKPYNCLIQFLVPGQQVFQPIYELANHVRNSCISQWVQPPPNYILMYVTAVPSVHCGRVYDVWHHPLSVTSASSIVIVIMQGEFNS